MTAPACQFASQLRAGPAEQGALEPPLRADLGTLAPPGSQQQPDTGAP